MDVLHGLLAQVEHKLAWVADEDVDWKFYVQAFSWSVTSFETYLLIRQYPLYSKTEPPSALRAHFEPGVFEKSQRYGRDKARFSIITGLLKQAIDSALLQYNFYPWAWAVAGTATQRAGYGDKYEIIHSLIFSAILFLASSIPSIPLSAYHTFVLEEAHGFNKTTPTLFAADLVKSWALALVIGAPFLAAFLAVFGWAGERFVPWLMAFLISFQLIMVVLYPTVIQPLFNTLSPLPTGALRNRVEALAAALRFPLARLYVIDGSKRSAHSNAYFFGLPWSKHIVIFDTLLSSSPSSDDVLPVLAHELGHWHHMHPAQLMLVSQLHMLGMLTFFPAFWGKARVLGSFGFSFGSNKGVAGRGPVIVSFLLYQMIITPLEAVVGIALNAMSRHFEWQADRFACELPKRLAGRDGVRTGPDESGREAKEGEGEGKEGEDEDGTLDVRNMGARLGRALVTLHVKNLSTVWVDWLYSAYHHSHPTLTERLKALEAFEVEQGKKVL